SEYDEYDLDERNNNDFQYYEDLEVKSSNMNKNDFNIIAISDVGCSLRAQENIKNIEDKDPELFLVVGDLSYKETPDCWFDMTKSLDSKTKIAIGNHDAYEEVGITGEKLKDAYLEHYGMNNSYYSFDYQNVHVLVLDTQLELSVDTLESNAKLTEKVSNKPKSEVNLEKQEPLLGRYPEIPIKDLFEEESVDIEIPKLKKYLQLNSLVPDIKVDKNQYQFVLEDLKKASQNEDVDWIIVMLHKPLYSSLSKQFEEYIIRDKYQEIFDKYGVDLVIQGHNHIYSRTLPLTYNNLDISQPEVDSASSKDDMTFTNADGAIYLVVGLGGEEIHRIVDNPYYIANYYNDGFGFLNLDIQNKRIDGTFYDINLNCQIKITEKKKKEVMDLKSCVPSDVKNPTIVDQFTIKKIGKSNDE
ncbi:MAG: metallophosphoesterase, partial [Nitrososphaeraceae archaeon]|nr:metallophosphoesterase [Nitrososphaeraceae archaeon]